LRRVLNGKCKVSKFEFAKRERWWVVEERWRGRRAKMISHFLNLYALYAALLPQPYLSNSENTLSCLDAHVTIWIPSNLIVNFNRWFKMECFRFQIQLY
jgi:hypothetical protein